MIIEVFRDTFGQGFTLSDVSIDGAHFCYCVEDEDRNLESGGVKVYGKTAIPRGEYKVTLSMSNRFKKILPEVHDVPQFAGVRIHAGNTAEDSEGCLLFGMARDKRGGAVYNSRMAMSLLIPKIEQAINVGDDVCLRII